MTRLLKVVGLVLGGLVGLAVTAYVVQGVVGSIHVDRARDRAVADLERGLPQAQDAARRQRDRVLRQLGEWGRPRHSWTELTCSMGTVDGGWIVLDHTQECDIRTVDLVPVDDAPRGACETLPVDAQSDSSHLSWTEAVLAPTTEIGDAQAPYPCPGDVLAPPRHGRLLEGGRPARLTGSPAWVVVETRTEVSRTVVGCDPWVVLLCDEPYEEPVTGE